MELDCIDGFLKFFEGKAQSTLPVEITEDPEPLMETWADRFRQQRGAS